MFFELSVIMLISLVAEGMRLLLGLPIPASIYGLIVLFLMLLSGIIKVEKIKRTSSFLLSIMPIMFVPAGVAIMDNFEIMKPALLPIILVATLSTALVMTVSAYVSQKAMRGGRNNG